ncbi:MAG: hypothetical protein R3E12_07725 [Candidatus Eisenbacteria bacterium]
MRTKQRPQSEGWITLAEVVDERELARITQRLRDVSCPVLDFSQTVHIRWKDAAAFARDLLAAGFEAPVRLVGLDEYCARILMFAWPLEAWEVFAWVTEEAGRDLGEDRTPALDSTPVLHRWAPDPSWTPNLN